MYSNSSLDLGGGPSSSPRVRQLSAFYLHQILESGCDASKSQFMAYLDNINRDLLGVNNNNISDNSGDNGNEEDDCAEDGYSNNETHAVARGRDLYGRSGDNDYADESAHNFSALLISPEMRNASHDSLQRIKELRLGLKRGGASSVSSSFSASKETNPGQQQRQHNFNANHSKSDNSNYNSNTNHSISNNFDLREEVPVRQFKSEGDASFATIDANAVNSKKEAESEESNASILNQAHYGEYADTLTLDAKDGRRQTDTSSSTSYSSSNEKTFLNNSNTNTMPNEKEAAFRYSNDATRSLHAQRSDLRSPPFIADNVKVQVNNNNNNNNNINSNSNSSNNNNNNSRLVSGNIKVNAVDKPVKSGKAVNLSGLSLEGYKKLVGHY